MHVSWAVFLIFHLARFSITAAVLIVNETVVFSSIDDCYLPEITFSTIQNRFSLIAFTDEGNETWPLSFPGALHVGQAQLDSPDQDEQWFTTLNLIGGKLITDNRNSVYFQPRNRNPPQVDEYGAVYYPGPRLQSIPPVLEELSYRFDASNASQFWASYSCDAKKNLFLELKTTQAFAVREFRQHTPILGKPKGTEEKAISIRVKIDHFVDKSIDPFVFPD